MSHFIIVSTAPNAGLDLQIVHNDRFLPVLASLPVLYLSLLIFNEEIFSKFIFILTIIQALIILLVIHVRTDSIFWLLYLFFIYFFFKLLIKIKPALRWKYLLNKIQLWPIVIVLIGFSLLKLHLVIGTHPHYSGANSNHLFWHTMYIGLFDHPESFEKTGKKFADDSVAESVFFRYKISKGIKIKSIVDWDEYEDVLKKEYLKILFDDPIYFIQNYLYKPVQFLEKYFSEKYAILPHLYGFPMVLIIFNSILLSKNHFKNLQKYFLSVLFVFAFTMISPILASPEIYLISSPSLILTIIIFFFSSFLVNHLKCFFKKFVSLR